MAVTPALPRHQRRQAHLVDRVATRWDSCARRINLFPFPPRPPTKWLRARRGKLGRKGGWVIVFLKWKSESFLNGLYSVDAWCCILVESVAAVRLYPDFESACNPRICIKIPRIGCFYPHLALLGLGTGLSLSLFIFKKRERERRLEKNGVKAGFEHPRVFVFYPRFVLYYFWLYVEKVLKKQSCCGCTIEHSCGLQLNWGSIHDPRREMPMYPRRRMVGGLCHG